jgi:hypothetical protein
VKNISWFGIALIATGSVLLLHRLGYIDFGVRPLIWLLMAAFGAVRCFDGFRRRRQARVFWSAFIFFFGAYNLGWYVERVDELLPSWPTAMVLMVGLSFFLTYASAPRSWHVIVPGLALTGFGVAMLMTDYGYLYTFDVLRLAEVLLPVALILFGVSLILQRTLHKSQPGAS